MDTYAATTALSSYGADATTGNRPLESLASAAMRVNSAAVRLDQFIDRFNGAEPTLSHGTAAPEAPAPYAQNIERLFSAIERLEMRVDTILSIG